MLVAQVSANLADLTGVEAGDAVGRPLSKVLGVEVSSKIERAMGVFGDLQERNPLEAVIDVDDVPVELDAILHRAPNDTVLVELERSVGPRPFSFPNTYLAVRRAVSDLNQTASLTELYEITARAVRALTGFDRVMVYRYDHEFNGEVVAEEKRSDLNSFLGLHYPASDIPAQARALYEKNWIRLISNVDYRPVPLVPNLDPGSGQPLDLTLSTLRSVSPIHIEYLHNMGVRASMSISLLRHGVLWGLIACHHYSGPHTPPYGVRAAAEFLGSTLSLRLVDRAEEDELRSALGAQSVLGKLVAATLAEDDPLVSALLGAPSLLDLIPADGVVVAAEGQVASLGAVPGAETVEAVARWVRSMDEDLVATDSMMVSAPVIVLPPALACGVLALALPEDQYVLWFRAEARHAVDWGGDPHNKAIAVQEGDSLRLSPRTSFDRWQEVVHDRSEPWTADQRQLALDLRAHAVEALYTRSQRGLRLAERLQRSLLPPSLPDTPGWKLSAHYQTAQGGQVGGDWYDALMLGDDILTVVIGDVAGHGVAAAGTMAQLRNGLRAYLLTSPSPGEALESLNRFATLLVPDAFATAVIACVDVGTGAVRAASAGHLIPYVVSAGRQAVPAALTTSPPLGLPGTEYVVSEFTVAPGEGLVFFSDGLVERRSEDLELSLGRFSATLSRLGPTPSATDVFEAVADPGSFDDASVLAVHRMKVQ